MKVLWFTLTPSLADTAVGPPVAAGGWMRALEQELQDRVDLSVAFYTSRVREPFALNGTTYYPMPRPAQDLPGKIRSRLTHGLEGDSDIVRLMEVVDAVDPEVIHVHGTEGPFGLVQRHTERPVLLSVQGLVTAYEAKFFSGIARADTRRVSELRRGLVKDSFSDQYTTFRRKGEREREILLLARFVAGRTEWDRRVTSVLAPQASYFVADEILRASFYDAVWRPHARPELRLFTTTGPNLYKGFETVVRGAALLDQLGVRYQWRVAGLTPDHRISRLAQAATGVTLSPSVRLLGRVEEPELVEELLDSDLYVGVSHIENSPNSLCEALLVGVPAVTTFAGGTSSLVTDGVDGVLVQDGDPYSLAGAVLELHADPDRAAELGANARTRALVRHDRERVRDVYLDIYRDVAASSRPR